MPLRPMDGKGWRSMAALLARQPLDTDLRGSGDKNSHIFLLHPCSSVLPSLPPISTHTGSTAWPLSLTKSAYVQVLTACPVGQKLIGGIENIGQQRCTACKDDPSAWPAWTIQLEPLHLNLDFKIRWCMRMFTYVIMCTYLVDTLVFLMIVVPRCTWSKGLSRVFPRVAPVEL